jgi:hypothetical protein
VWAVDEAATQVYGKMISESGESEGFRAGGLASQRLVDYAHLSPLQNALRYVAPFGTFRGGVPGAVAGGVARMPARAAFYNRLSGNTMYGSKPQPGSSGWQQYNPTADVGRGLGAPNEFAQATLGATASAVIGATADTLFPRKFSPWDNPVAYGQSWLPKRLSNGQLDLGFVASSALAGVPEAETLLESIGISRFKWKGLANEAMRQTLGLQHLSASP